MEFDPKKFSDIVDGMQGLVNDLDDFQVGSVTRTLMESFASELGLLYQKMKLVYLSAFISSATETNLEQVVAVLGIERGMPDYATGSVTFTRDKGKEDILIPIGTLVATDNKPGNPKKVYETIEVKTLKGSDQAIDVKVKAKDSGPEQATGENTISVIPRPISGIKSVTNSTEVKFSGKERETDDQLRERAKNALISSGKATTLSIIYALISLPEVLDVKVLENFTNQTGYGIIDIIVDLMDGFPFDDAEKAKLFTVINKVKAAGIYPRLQAAAVVTLNGVFRLEAGSDQVVNQYAQTDLEGNVKVLIEDFINHIKIGEPILKSNLLKAIYSMQDVENLIDYHLMTIDAHGTETAYSMTDPGLQINVKDLERLKAGDICVASCDKICPVDVELQVDNLTNPALLNLKNAVTAYASGLSQGSPFKIKDLASALKSFTPHAETIKVVAHTWSPRKDLYLTDNKLKITGVNVSFVEQAALGKLFAYSAFLDITGALNLTLINGNTLDKPAREVILLQVLPALEDYMSCLGPEQPVMLDDLAGAAKKVAGVEAASWNIKDFLVNLGSSAQPDRLKDKKSIVVKTFEKVRLAKNSFIVSDRIEQVNIVVSNLSYELQAKITDKEKSDLKTLILNTINHFLDNAVPGEDVNFNALRASIENLLPNAPATVRSMTVTATSSDALNDGRKQVSTLTSPRNIHIRSVEVAYMVPYSGPLPMVRVKNLRIQ